ncbi:hypothetical protein [Hyalangium versicolor]|uniref:hypothetical protein n=1 Tax=Hyalangium versicolor TaxID=2861190 RepID=UPI001CCD4AD9|nr:hypothetical protein [Hyalangium versicolor]
MALHDLETLQKKAIEEGLAFAQQHLTGDFLAEPIAQSDDAALTWDPVELRYVADRSLVLWRRYGQFEVVLDAEDRVVGYVDHDKWEKCRWEPLTKEEALAIARNSGLLRPGLELVESREGEKGSLELLLAVPREEPSQGLRVCINPARRAVISVLPVEDEAP